MVRGRIIIRLVDGTEVSYANKYLYKKAGLDADGNPKTDNAGVKKLYDRYGKPIMIYDKETGTEVQAEENVSTPLFDGYPEHSYYYTGYGDDTFDDQTELGEIKADYEYLKNQLGVAGNTLLRFPEKDESHGDTMELVRLTTSVVNGVETYSRISIEMEKVVSITIKEDWATFPYGRESGYQLSKMSPNFMGFHETEEIKLKDFDRGPDFNKNIKYDNGFIPNPKLAFNKAGTLVCKNESDYDEIVTTELKDGFEVYGILNGKKTGKTYINNSEKGTYCYAWILGTNLLYTVSETPQVGDYAYTEDGSSDTINGLASNGIKVGDGIYLRKSSEDGYIKL